MVDVMDRDQAIGSGGDEQAIVVRFAGDSGDGVQVLGGEFAKSSALTGYDLMTFPDFPAEIRAPTGTLFGVSAFQLQFGGRRVLTAGDDVDVLVIFNPAALKTNLETLKQGGTVIVDDSSFTARNLSRAGYDTDPLDELEKEGIRVIRVPITKLTEEAVSDLEVGKKVADRAKNFWALGLVYWLFGRDRAPTQKWITEKFGKLPLVADVNLKALNAGHTYGDVSELEAQTAVETADAVFQAGTYRSINGAEATALGLAAIGAVSGVPLSYCSYPITPASSLLHELAKFRGKGVSTFQAEDEIAAVSAAVGASFAGNLGVTGSSGPGIALKAEALGLAVATELPLLVVDVQRAGPSTGMPTKPEQSDLMMAVAGRHGEAPCPVLAPKSPSDCFATMLEAGRIALSLMTPVMFLSDAYIANASEPWAIPDVNTLPDIPTRKIGEADADGFHPFRREQETLARNWAAPGTPGLEHRIGGIEKAADSGHISYDPSNHQRMTELRRQKIDQLSETGLQATLEAGADEGDLVIVTWGSAHGAVKSAVSRAASEGQRVGHVHLTQVWPLPANLGAVLRRYGKVAVAELNEGQLKSLIRSELLIPATGINQITGQPFKSATIRQAIGELL